MKRLNIIAAAAVAVLPVLAQAGSVTATGSVYPAITSATDYTAWNSSTSIRIVDYSATTDGSMTADNATVTSGGINVGYNSPANGTLTLQNGTNWTSTYIYVGSSSYSATGPATLGTFNVSDSTFTTSGVNIGNSAPGTATFTNSTISAGSLGLGSQINGTGSMTVNHTTATFSGAITVGNAGSATMSITNGSSVTASRAFIIGATNASAQPASVTLGGGTGTSTLNIASNFEYLPYTVAGLFIGRGSSGVGTGSLTVASGGVLNTGITSGIVSNITIASGATSTGTLNISGGTVNLNGTSLLKGDGTANFNFTSGLVENALAIGSSTKDFNFSQAGGTLTAGTDSSVGTTTLYGTYGLGSGATLQADIAGIGSSDTYAVTGNATLAGLLKLNALAGYVPTNGDSFSILTAANIDTTGLTTNSNWHYSVTGAAGAQTLVATYAVPEPASLAVLSLGGVGMLARRRRAR